MTTFTFTVSDDWNSSFIGDVLVSDVSKLLTGWTIEFDVPFEIEEIWGAEIVSQNGDRYTIRNVWWNEDVASGQGFNFGFKAKGSATGLMSNVELNGQFLDTGASGSGNSDDPGNDIDPNPGDSAHDSGGDDGSISSPQTGMFNYGEALQKSFLFYEAQRSGALPDDNRLDWRGDSGLSDGQDVGIDLTGGYYDAGNYVKAGFAMASSITMLAWGVTEYEDAYAEAGQLDEALDAIQWGTNYFLKTHITDVQGTSQIWGYVDEKDSVWLPVENSVNRISDKIDRDNPGSDLAGETAAALAAAAIAFRDSDPDYADTLVENAIQLFEFADQYRGRYSDHIPTGGYPSSGYIDELVWGATWLYKATGDSSYLEKAEGYYDSMPFAPSWTHDWNDKAHGSTVLLAQETNDQKYRNNVEQWLDYWSDTSGSGIVYTSGGLAWANQWGSLRYSANTAFIAGVYSDTVNDYDSRYSDFANGQIDYILGDNPNQFSYMVGFGDRYPVRPHHPSAHGVAGWENFRTSEPNDNILYGALVGGPASPDDFDYSDDRFDYIRNEVATDYNAGLTGALVRMYDEFGGDPLTDTQLNNLPGVSVPDAF